MPEGIGKKGVGTKKLPAEGSVTRHEGITYILKNRQWLNQITRKPNPSVVWSPPEETKKRFRKRAKDKKAEHGDLLLHMRKERKSS